MSAIHKMVLSSLQQAIVPVQTSWGGGKCCCTVYRLSQIRRHVDRNDSELSLKLGI
jgi:hypothetical protein